MKGKPSGKLLFAYTTISNMEATIKKLEREIDLLRMYGNKDCTAMADKRLAEIQEKEK